VRQTSSGQFLILGAIFAGLAVAAGAFGAHFLKSILDAKMLGVFETGARYQMYHALGLCIVSLASERYSGIRTRAVGWLFTGGIVLFSGSLYGLSLSGIRGFGALTPLGGAAFIIGWGVLAWGMWRSPRTA
jgi:uncharacterized membrane protein YgdD (TMEM256/DUF423 family)